MTRLQKLLNQKAELLKQLRAINETADADVASKGVLTAEQDVVYKELEAQVARVNATIDAERRLVAEEAAAPVVASAPANGSRVRVQARAEEDPRRGFPMHRDFFLSVIDNAGRSSREQVSDERLRPLAVASEDGARGELAYLLPRGFNPSFLATAGSDEQGAYSDPYGGYAVPKTLLPGMLQLGFEGDPTSGRTQAIPMASPTVELLARTDKNHATSVSGGFTVTRKPETVAATASRGEMEKVTLKASTLMGLAYATEEILTDSVISFIALIDAGFRDQFAHNMLREKIRGLGGSEYQGVIGADCSIAESRDTSTRILGDDVIQMRARCWGYGQAIWLANHDAFPELMRLGAAAYDTLAATPLAGSNALYVQSIREDRPDSLLGRPIFYSEYPSTLGSAGDLILANWSQYLEGLYQPLQSAESMHVRFVNHERTFKLWLRNAGAPWWRTALTPNQSTTTLSPFVILAA